MMILCSGSVSDHNKQEVDRCNEPKKTVNI